MFIFKTRKVCEIVTNISRDRAVVFVIAVFLLIPVLLNSEAGAEEAEDYITPAVQAIYLIPDYVTIEAQHRVQDARNLVDLALSEGVLEEEIENLDLLLAAEEQLETEKGFLFSDGLRIRDWVSIFNLDDAGKYTHANWSYFVDYETRWQSGHTINGRSFDPLLMFPIGHTNLTTPRWVEYDIGDEGFELVKGYVGVPDHCDKREYPLDFAIFVDDVAVFDAKLEFEVDAIPFEVDLKGAEKVKFQLSAEQLEPGGTRANRVAIVEPRFLMGPVGFINKLPDYASINDKDDVALVREVVDNALSSGLYTEEDIHNLAVLEAAEKRIEEEIEFLFEYGVQVKEWVSLFDITEDYIQVGLASFLDYSFNWVKGHTINGVNYDPLRVYTGDQLVNLHTSTRWVEYTITGKELELMKGFVGIPDHCSRQDYPLLYKILGDGQVLFEAVLEYGAEAVPYLLDIEGVDKLKIEISADSADAFGQSNLIAVVEPMFLRGNVLSEKIAAAEAAINNLPAQLELGHLEDILGALALVEKAMEGGAKEAHISNLQSLEDAVAAMAGLFVTEAVAAIDALPAEITPDNREAVEEARALVNSAFQLGASENDIGNLERLVEAERPFAVSAAIRAIDELPSAADLKLGDREAVRAARKLVDEAIAKGALEEDITNLDKLQLLESKLPMVGTMLFWLIPLGLVLIAAGIFLLRANRIVLGIRS